MTETSIPAQRISRFDERKCRGNLSLEKDVLTIKGWCLRGRISRTIRLQELNSVKAVPSRTGNNIFFSFSDGGVAAMRLNKGVVYIAHTLNDLLGQFRLEKKTLPGKVEYRKAV